LAFVEAAEEEILKTSPQVNISRLSMMTGLYRKDVARIHKEQKAPLRGPRNVIAQILGQWQEDRRFQTTGRKPRTLSFSGEQNEFRTLVQTVDPHINPGTILFELLRLGLVRKTPQGLRLVREMYGLQRDPVEGFQLLSRDLNSLLSAVEENLLTPQPIANLHIRTEYDNIDPQDLPEIKQWLLDRGREFHRGAREFVSKFDRDLSSSAESTSMPASGPRARVVVTTFSDTEENLK
jgi:hypothetical protein